MGRGGPSLALWLALAAGLAGCGPGEPPPLPTNSKVVPTLEERYQRRDLADWRSVPDAAPAEERAAQAWALGVLAKDPLADLDLLLARLRDEDPGVRLAAAVSLGRLAPPSERAARALAGLLGDPQEPLRRHARLALARLGAAALRALQEALDAERAGVRWAAVEALGQIGPPAAPLAGRVEALARADAHESVRRQAGLSLARMGEAGIAACVRLWRAEAPEVRGTLERALVAGGAGVVGPMAALLADPDEDLAARAAGVLADLGPACRPALDPLVAALRREGPVASNALEALAHLGAAARARIEPLTRDPDERVAFAAQYLLERLDAER